MAATVRLESATDEEWDEAYADSPSATFFHSRPWLNAWREGNGATRAAYALKLRLADGTQALAPVLSVLPFPRLLRAQHFSSAAGTYGGWFSSAKLSQEQASALWRQLFHVLSPLTVRANPFDETQSRTFVSSLPPQARLVDYRPEVTQLLDLRCLPADVRAHFRKGHRAAVSQAERAGVVCRIASDRKTFAGYCRLYELAQQRWGAGATSHYSPAQLARIVALPGADLWVAELGAKLLAGGITLSSQRHVSYWHGAQASDSGSTRPVHALVHAMVEHAKTMGLAYFDFNPSAGHQSVIAFKRGFRPRVVACPSVQLDLAWLQALRRLRR